MNEAAKPRVLRWYVAYCLAMAGLYVLCLLFSLWLILAPESEEAGPLMGGVLFGVALLCLLGYVIGAFLRPRRWFWTYGTVLIGIGMTSICILPVALPLLIFWCKEDTKRYFGA